MSRNDRGEDEEGVPFVAPREGRVSRNDIMEDIDGVLEYVAPREGRVSRNFITHHKHE